MKTVTKTVFLSEPDGREFDTPEECQDHENERAFEVLMLESGFCTEDGGSCAIWDYSHLMRFAKLPVGRKLLQDAIARTL